MTTSHLLIAFSFEFMLLFLWYVGGRNNCNTQRNDPTRRIRTLTRFCLILASLDACLMKKRTHGNLLISRSRLFRSVAFIFLYIKSFHIRIYSLFHSDNLRNFSLPQNGRNEQLNCEFLP